MSEVGPYLLSDRRVGAELRYLGADPWNLQLSMDSPGALG
jgi:hypothetical protein